jgi:hypothetical protein
MFGYSEAKANNLANWYWITTVIALVLTGFASDRLRVRKPLMLLGAVISLVGIALFAAAATKPHTGYHTFAWYFVLIAGGTATAYVAWLAGFTETVEKHNPAATATGLAIWGWTIRIVVTLSFAILPAVVPATTTLVDKAPRLKAIAAAYPKQVKVLQTVDPATLAALHANPANPQAQVKALSELSGLPATRTGEVVLLGTKYKSELATAAAIDPATLVALAANPANRAAAATAVGEIASKLGATPAQALPRLQALGKVPPADLALLRSDGAKVQAAGASLRSVSTVPAVDLAYLAANAPKVIKAQRDNPGQWQTWWWICFLGQLAFLPVVFLLSGRWSPKKAKEDEQAHELLVQAELARLEPAPANAYASPRAPL